ncbi:phytanoyl-CoA dioxygenase family protein [Streptomyces sp. NPDC004752]
MSNTNRAKAVSIRPIPEEVLNSYIEVDERRRLLAPSGEAGQAHLNDRPISNRSLDSFARPTPALTPAQRLHLDIYGYVVIENVLTPDEVNQLRNEIYNIERRALGGDSLEDLRPAFVRRHTEDIFQFANLPHVSPAFFDYLTHPRIVGMAEESMGGPARLHNSQAHIRRAPADPDRKEHGNSNAYGWHRGSVGMAGTIANGLYHFPFVVALTNLTDLGPDDGGTSVIAGTHKIPGEVDLQPLIDAAEVDPSLIHHVEAPAGSTLLFFESLVHSGGIIRSGRDRLLVIGWYAPPFWATPPGSEPSVELVGRLPKEYQRFMVGWTSNFSPDIQGRSLTDYPPEK